MADGEGAFHGADAMARDAAEDLASAMTRLREQVAARASALADRGRHEAEALTRATAGLRAEAAEDLHDRRRRITRIERRAPRQVGTSMRAHPALWAGGAVALLGLGAARSWD